MTKQDYLILRRRIHQLLPLSATLFNLGQITIELPAKVTKLEQLLKILINDDPKTNYNHMHKLEIEIQAKLAHLSRQYRHIETSGRETKWLSSSTLRPLHLYHPLRSETTAALLLPMLSCPTGSGHHLHTFPRYCSWWCVHSHIKILFEPSLIVAPDLYWKSFTQDLRYVKLFGRRDHRIYWCSSPPRVPSHLVRSCSTRKLFTTSQSFPIG